MSREDERPHLLALGVRPCSVRDPVAGRVAPAHVFGVLGTAGSWFGQMPNPSHPSLMGTGKREPGAALRATKGSGVKSLRRLAA